MSLKQFCLYDEPLPHSDLCCISQSGQWYGLGCRYWRDLQHMDWSAWPQQTPAQTSSSPYLLFVCWKPEVLEVVVKCWLRADYLYLLCLRLHYVCQLQKNQKAVCSALAIRSMISLWSMSRKETIFLRITRLGCITEKIKKKMVLSKETSLQTVIHAKWFLGSILLKKMGEDSTNLNFDLRCDFKSGQRADDFGFHWKLLHHFLLYKLQWMVVKIFDLSISFTIWYVN